MQLRFSQIHVTILNFVLIAALAIVSAMCVRDIIARSVANEADTPASSSARRAALGARTRTYYDQIVKRDIFNETPQESGPAPAPVEEDLNIKLIGTSILSRSKPYAIIEDPTGEESLYQVGEDIPDAGKLVSVETSRAIIDRGGHRVAIEIPSADMPEPSPSHLGNPAGAVHRPAGGFAAGMRERLRGLRGFRPNIPARGNDNSDDSSKIELKKLGPGKFEVSRAEVQQTMENPAQFFSQMRAMPHFVNGKTDGFSISEVAPGSVFQQLGLQDGDLLTSIDGQPVTNPMQAMGLIQAVKTASAIDLTVNRGGAPTSVHLDLR
ncbi:MAG: type II secretion system protein GspC [Candidatus Binatus sp.]|jgi:general secretion pathway protein C|uniref:type II secretion system protein GspC n=1 Tax=Candidatus Binatus sp. TaxID=2811406 RepID=UPI003C788D54